MERKVILEDKGGIVNGGEGKEIVNGGEGKEIVNAGGDVNYKIKE